jgi:hypothetical protein
MVEYFAKLKSFRPRAGLGLPAGGQGVGELVAEVGGEFAHEKLSRLAETADMVQTLLKLPLINPPFPYVSTGQSQSLVIFGKLRHRYQSND